jgi:hypothetical protein
MYICNDNPPSCTHYSIKRKVTLNGRVVSEDTEQDLVLNAGPHWELFLEPKLDEILYKGIRAGELRLMTRALWIQ